MTTNTDVCRPHEETISKYGSACKSSLCNKCLEATSVLVMEQKFLAVRTKLQQLGETVDSIIKEEQVKFAEILKDNAELELCKLIEVFEKVEQIVNAAKMKAIVQFELNLELISSYRKTHARQQLLWRISNELRAIRLEGNLMQENPIEALAIINRGERVLEEMEQIDGQLKGQRGTNEDPCLSDHAARFLQGLLDNIACNPMLNGGMQWELFICCI